VTRRYARELALQTLYSVEVGHNEPAAALDQTLESTTDSDERGFVRDLVLGTLDNVERSDAAIVPLLQGWTIERLPILDRIVLRMSVYELQAHPETPFAVVVNEAVELAKKYSTEDSGRFVNGVLANASGTRPVAG
jgi:N utilization substance protein B